VPCPAVDASGLAVLADVGSIWRPVTPAGVTGRGCRVDQERNLRGSNGAGGADRRWMGPATGL
jgi:hypothetical protein